MAQNQTSICGLRRLREAAVAAEASALHGSAPSGETVIASGAYDIYGDTASRLIARYPGAHVITHPAQCGTRALDAKPCGVAGIAGVL
jgi:hypothetical protein